MKYKNPILRANWRRNRALVISPLHDIGLLLYKDANPDFDLITYSFDGTDLNKDLMNGLDSIEHYKFKSEFWGDSFFKLCSLIDKKYQVVCFMNSDIHTSISNMNLFFELSDLYDLDFCQPSLTSNSYISHPHTIHIPGGGVVEVPFIEVMMPCISSKVISEVVKIGLTTISGWGIDNYLFPHICESLKLNKPAVIHDCKVTHTKPVSSNILFSDGLFAEQQMEQLKIKIEKLNQKAL